MIDASPVLPPRGAHVLVDGRALRIERRAGTDARPILRLEGYADRDAAESLRGRELLVPRDRAPELEPDEWWAEDLVGCAVRDGERPVGTVTRLLALPSCEVLEVARPHTGAGDGGDGGDGGERSRDRDDPLLVPLVTDAVREVDLERGAIDIDLRFLGEE